MFAGPNGSGKSSLYKGLVEEGHFHPTTFLNADEIQQRLDAGLHVRFPLDATADVIPRMRCSSFLDHGLTASDIDGLIVDPTQGMCLKKGFSCGSYLAAAIADVLRILFIEENRSFAFETVMSHESKLDLLAKARIAGYRNYLYFVTTGDPMLNIERVRQRVAEGGHPVEKEKIIERYARCMALLPRALRLCDRAYLFDNSQDKSRLVAVVSEGKNLKLESTLIPKWVDLFLSEQAST